jgi:hypothetical protein
MSGIRKRACDAIVPRHKIPETRRNSDAILAPMASAVRRNPHNGAYEVEAALTVLSRKIQ